MYVWHVAMFIKILQGTKKEDANVKVDLEMVLAYVNLVKQLMWTRKEVRMVHANVLTATPNWTMLALVWILVLYLTSFHIINNSLDVFAILITDGTNYRVNAYVAILSVPIGSQTRPEIALVVVTISMSKMKQETDLVLLVRHYRTLI